jgi:hypothetical protein
MLFTYKSTNIKENNYTKELLELSLEKTISEYGSYKINITGAENQTQKRALSVMNQSPELKLVFMKAYDDMYKEFSNITYIPFPTDLNIAGYRVCLSSPAKKELLRNIKSRSDLMSLRIVQSTAWADAHILSANGLTTVLADPAQIYKFAAYGRADLLCIPANHIDKAMENGKFKEGLVLNESFALYYPMPRFLFINSTNKREAERITKGLAQAYKDQSMQTLWGKYFSSSIKQAQLGKRLIIPLKNPFLTTLSVDYEQYIYKPN